MSCLYKRFRDVKRKMNRGSKHKLLNYSVSPLVKLQDLPSHMSFLTHCGCVDVLMFLFTYSVYFRLFQHGEISQDQATTNWPRWWKAYPTPEGTTGPLFHPIHFLSLPGCSLASWMWSHLWQNPSHRYPFFMSWSENCCSLFFFFLYNNLIN